MIRIPPHTDKDIKVIVLKQNSVAETYPLHCHDFFEFFLVTKGRATHTVNNAIQIIERGSLVFIRPDDEHCYDFYKTNDFEFYNAGMTREHYASLKTLYAGHTQVLEDSLLPRHIKLSEVEIHHLEGFLCDMRELTNFSDFEIQFARTVSFVIYLLLTKEEFSNNKMIPDWLLYVRDEMNKKENFIAGLPRLIELSNYSQEHISREFKRYMEITPTQYINKLRLRYAYELLISTSQEIVDVCQNSGFNNLSHFYTEFKKNYGCSPNLVRKEQPKNAID